MDPTPVINPEIVASMIDLCKSVLGLFTEFPLNIIVIGSLANVAMRILRGAKRVAR